MTTIREFGADAILLAGGGRAILMQIANPAVGAGVAAHSDFASRPLDRLNDTLTFVYAQLFGDENDRRIAARRVNRAHGPVRSAGDGERSGYSAFDPALQLWVAATLYETAVTVHERVYGPLDAASAEQIYRDYAVLGTALQVPDGLWPATLPEFRSYWEAELTALTVGPGSRSVANELLRAASAPLWLRAAMPSVRLVTASLLDERMRAAYGFRWSQRQQRRSDRLLRAVRMLWPRIPRTIRHWPPRHYLARLRRSER